MTTSERFWSKVVRGDGCWEWTAAKRPKGYGAFGITRDKAVIASRYAYEDAIGAIPHDKCVLHRCDNPSCVRPDHLFLGTRGDNNRDSVAKGRNSKGDKHSLVTRGERNGRAKLNPDQIVEIRQLYRGPRRGPTLSWLAHRYSMSIPQIHSIVRGLSWSHVASR